MANRLVCHGCGYQPPLEEARPFACPNAERDDNVDHVLRRVFDAQVFRSAQDPRDVFLDPEPNPFRRYRSLMYSYEMGKYGGVSDRAYLDMVDRLNAGIAAIDRSGSGSGFGATPFDVAPALAGAIGLEGASLWIKDETGNVSGSHKVRHLLGLMLWLEVSGRLGRESLAARLAIASCGNAALAAGVVACAAGRSLEVFVPADGNQRTLARLTELGARLTTCARQKGDPPGDPCLHGLLERLEASATDAGGAIPFSCQGKLNGLAIEGGCTLAWEMVSTLVRKGAHIDHLIVQVGGGALATACIEGLRNAVALGLIGRLPRIHTVQTESAYPLRRAYDSIAKQLLEGDDPTDAARDPATAAERARRICDQVAQSQLTSALEHARRHRGDYMWPWEKPPRSIASGILDDETYDWVAVCEGMLETGGLPLVVDEDTLARAHGLGREYTSIVAEPTGTAGLAGLLELQQAGLVRPGESVALVFTGVER